MNLLIIAGLLVVGVAAIVGVVLLGLGERRTATRAAAAATANAPAIASAPQTRETVTTSLPTPTRQSVPTAAYADRESQLPPSYHQLQELAAELRVLQQRAGEIERRLSIVNEMVDLLEDEQGRIPAAVE